MGRVLVAAVYGVLCSAGVAQETKPFLPGTLIPSVVCTATPQQTYALYLPSTYSPNKRWPIIYAFDPGARGQVAVEAIRAAAEKTGYIVVASNNSRNGAEAVSREAAKAMWYDTEQRFSIDEPRRYLTGMSGGARMAAELAISCHGCVAGVISNAAGFPRGRSPSSALQFRYFAAYGNADFNFLEFVDLRRELEQSGMQYRIRVFDGQHGWAPPDVWEAALNWMNLQAMRAGFMNRDPVRIKDLYDAALERAAQLLAQQDVLEAFREYGFAVRDFSGLTDVAGAEKKAMELANDKRLKNAGKQELSTADNQRRLMAEPSQQIQELAEGGLTAEDLLALRANFATMRTSQATTDARGLATRRALGGLIIQAFESGQFAMDKKKYDVALRLFDLVVVGSENPGWGHYHRARAYAALTDKKHMLAELMLASKAGFRDATTLATPEFEPFKPDPEFQVLLRAWSMNAHP